MTVLEKKVEMATAILSDIDEIRITEMEKTYKKLYKSRLPEPCVYSVEELRESVLEFEKELAAGSFTGKTTEEVFEKYGL